MFRYEPDGTLRWAYTRGARAQQGAVCGSTRADGYVATKINSRSYKLHQLVWAYHRGCWPTLDIDHINGDKADNRIENLRECTHAENCANRVRPNKNNPIGVKDVHRLRDKWQVAISFQGKAVYGGVYDTPEQAIAARDRLKHKMIAQGRDGEAKPPSRS